MVDQVKVHKKNRFVRYRDLKWSDINCDLHIHTSYTDGQSDIRAILEHAVDLGLKRIAFTEHVRKESAWFKKFADEVRKEGRLCSPIEVLVACETKARDCVGTLDVNEETLGECDFVVGSVHRFPAPDGGYLDFASLDQNQMERCEYEMALGLLTKAPIDVLAHPGGMSMKKYGGFSSDLMKSLLEASLRRKVAIEINASYIQNLPDFLDICARINPYVSIGSDVHELHQLGSCRDKLKAYGIGNI